MHYPGLLRGWERLGRAGVTDLRLIVPVPMEGAQGAAVGVQDLQQLPAQQGGGMGACERGQAGQRLLRRLWHCGVGSTDDPHRSLLQLRSDAARSAVQGLLNMITCACQVATSYQWLLENCHMRQDRCIVWHPSQLTCVLLALSLKQFHCIFVQSCIAIV